jgi:hypothetical protein
MRAAGFPQISTVCEPPTIISGGPEHTQVSPKQAAGILLISTVGAQGPMIGPPTCGIGVGNAGVCIGQECMSVSLAAGGIVVLFLGFYCFFVNYFRFRRHIFFN